MPDALGRVLLARFIKVRFGNCADAAAAAWAANTVYPLCAFV